MQQGQGKGVNCDRCCENVPSFDIVHYGSIEHGYRKLCSKCFNAAVAERSGVEDFENIHLEPIVMSDCKGDEHQFHFRTHLLGAIVSLEAFELQEGNPGGYQFQLLGEPEDDLFALLGRMIQRIRKALAIKHIQDGKLGLQIVDDTVRGRIEWDDTEDGRVPLMVVDGREISWEEFGQMLMGLEGWQFKLQIFDRSDEM